MKILIVGAIDRRKELFHHSDIKSIELAKGFRNIGHDCWILEESTFPGENEVPTISGTKFIVDDWQAIIFTRELHIEKILAKFKNFHRFFYKEGSRNWPLLCARFGALSWIKDLYKNPKQFYECFDFIFPQEWGIAKNVLAMTGDPAGKIWASTMGVPSSIPERLEESPYPEGKKALVYMGRLRHVPIRFDFLNAVMKKLGPSYHLHILPGSYSLSTRGEKINPQVNTEELQKQFNPEFITVEKPVPWGKHWNWLQWADAGLDLTPSKHRQGVGGGNAKLLEYMRAGLPVVTEMGITNGYVVRKVSGGVIVPVEQVNQYVRAVEDVCRGRFNRKRIADLMVLMESYEVRAKEIIDIFHMVKETTW